MSGSVTMKATFTRRPGIGHEILARSPEAERYAYRIARRIKDDAMAIFEIHNRKDNEWRVSKVTPPKYISSFRMEWHRSTLTYRVSNVDPGWKWVEYGAHAGGKTFILRYRPLGRALDLAAVRGVL